jgi:16S rRNA (uracil1498-N3)-methyltransferase
MSLPYFYEEFASDDLPILSEVSTHHAIHVLRMRIGEEIMLVNGEGLKMQSRIVAVSKKSIALEKIDQQQIELPKPTLHIAISFTKNNARIEWFIEKACEMGIYKITPLLTARSEKVFYKPDRTEKIIVSAMLQSQQCYKPILSKPTSLEEIVQGLEPCKYIAHCEEGVEKVSLHRALLLQKDTLILIGPEGDFTKDEIHLCHAKAQEVSLGNNRLRTETAGVYACAVFNAKNSI